MKAEKNKEFRRQKALKQRQGEYLAAQQKAEEERNRKQKEDIKRMHAERLRKKKAAEVRCTLLGSNTFLCCCARSSNSHTCISHAPLAAHCRRLANCGSARNAVFACWRRRRRRLRQKPQLLPWRRRRRSSSRG
jgi:hypothetical protein